MLNNSEREKKKTQHVFVPGKYVLWGGVSCIVLFLKYELTKSANADPSLMFHSEFGNSVVNKLSLPYENIWTLKA